MVEIYRKLVPVTFRKLLYDYGIKKILVIWRNREVIFKSKMAYYFYFLLPENEENKAYKFLGKYGLTAYPGDYSLNYNSLDVDMLWDNEEELRYVMHNERKLYFPTKYSDEKIKALYKSLLVEQDIESPHRYVEDYGSLKGYTLLDVGSAEGIFSLDLIEIVDKVILIEYEFFWQKPLMATFRPWKDKVTIVQKYISDQTEGANISLDELMEGTLDPIFLKMDIEGAEIKALNGAVKLLSESPEVKASICTYHHPDHPKLINDYFIDKRYKTTFSKGFLFWNRRLNTTMLRAEK